MHSLNIFESSSEFFDEFRRNPVIFEIFLRKYSETFVWLSDNSANLQNSSKMIEKDLRKIVKTSLLVCLQNKQNYTWLLGECSSRSEHTFIIIYGSLFSCKGQSIEMAVKDIFMGAFWLDVFVSAVKSVRRDVTVSWLAKE